MIPAEIIKLLKKVEFVTIATCDLERNCSAMQQYVVDVTKNYVYIADYVINKTWKNLRENHKATLSVMDYKCLTGYQLIGVAKVINSGYEFEKLLKKLEKRVKTFSVTRIIESVKSGIKSKAYEMVIPARLVFYKIKVNEITVISSIGEAELKDLGNVVVKMKKPVLKTPLVTGIAPLVVPTFIKTNSREDKKG